MPTNQNIIDITSTNSPYYVNLSRDITQSGYKYMIDAMGGPIEIEFDLANGTTIEFEVLRAGNSITFKSESFINGLGLFITPQESLTLLNPVKGDFVVFGYNQSGSNAILSSAGTFTKV
jgi:hypothetical protein